MLIKDYFTRNKLNHRHRTAIIVIFGKIFSNLSWRVYKVLNQISIYILVSSFSPISFIRQNDMYIDVRTVCWTASYVAATNKCSNNIISLHPVYKELVKSIFPVLH